MTHTATDPRTMNFGIEIETFGISCAAAARAIAGAKWTRGENAGQLVFPGATIVTESRYHTESNNAVRLADGRKWVCCYDGSVAQHGVHAEVVSPVLKYAEIEALQEVVRALRAAGAKTSAQTCGIHIHIDGFRTFSPKQIANIAKLTYQQEDLIVSAFGVDPSRRRWAAPVEEAFIERIKRSNPTTREALRTAWFGSENCEARARHHYDSSRYRGINLHALFFRGTVEFRYFNGTLHAGKVKTAVQFILFLAARGANARAVSAKKRTLPNGNMKYAVRVFLIRLGLNGDEFKSLRHHMLKHLPGDAAMSGGRPSASAATNAACAGAF